MPNWKPGQSLARALLLVLALGAPGSVVACADETRPNAPDGGGGAGNTSTRGTGGKEDATTPPDAGEKGTDAGSGGRDASPGSGGNGATPVPSHDSGKDTGAAPAGSTCGNHVVENDEQCDDGNHDEGDGCSGCVDTRRCDQCMQNAAADPTVGITFPPCAGLQGYAPAGPAAGEPRLDLCRAVYECALRKRCVEPGSATHCYCGKSTDDCLSPGAANGPCREEIEAALETSDPTTIVQSFGSTALPGGVALALLTLATSPDTCLAECLPGYLDGGSGGSGGTSGTGGTSSGGTSNSGGTSGSGGTSSSGGASSGGTAGTVGTAAEDLLLKNRGANCLACAKNFCPGGTDTPGLAEVDRITGTAPQTSPAAGTDNLKLALDLLGCVFPQGGTSCAASDASSCYCGTSGTDCGKQGSANGACKTFEERGVGSTNATDVGQRLGDGSWPGGAANVLVNCLNFNFNQIGDETCRECFYSPAP